jgi:hypothetical protein
MSYHEGSNWQAKKEDNKEPLYSIEAEKSEGVNWNQLRDKFFKECTDIEQFDQRGGLAERRIINIAPHDLFEWFKKQLQSVEAEKSVSSDIP